jgi:hypothetical protein
MAKRKKGNTRKFVGVVKFGREAKTAEKWELVINHNF